jgi:ABC-type polysaccharide/polyol phosphate export permease
MKLFSRLYPYKDLLIVYIWREFSIRYKQSLLGALWAIFQPLSMMLLFTFIFTYILKLEVSNYPKALFFYAGALPWTLFSSSVTGSIKSLSDNYDLITQIYFPREIMPLSKVVLGIIDFLIAFIFFIVLMFYFKMDLALNFLWIVPLLLLLIIFSTALSFLFSSLNVYYRDVGLASGFFIQLLFFISPVWYSIDHLNTKLKLILFLNPLTFIIENIRRCTLEGRDVILWQFLFVTLIICVFYVLSYKLFTRIEKNFADVI